MGYLEKDPRSPNYNSVKFTAPTSANETIKIGVQVGDGLGYIDTQIITLNVTQQPVNSCAPTLVYDNQATTSPSDTVTPGTVLTQAWRLKNTSNCDANGYRLALYPHDATFNSNAYRYQENTITQTSFSIVSNERDYATAEFYAPQTPGTYRLFFDIVNTNGNPLTPLSHQGRLYTEFTVIEEDSTPLSPTQGAVKGYIWPKEARIDGSQWRIAGENWHNNGEIDSGYAVGDYTFVCKAILGWTASVPMIISVNPGDKTTASCDYWPSISTGPTGELTVTYEEGKLYLQYSVNTHTDYMEIQYSFNGANWTTGFKKSIHTIRKGNQPIAINGSQDASTLYFRLKATQTSTNDVFISDTVTLNYETEPTVVVESPATPTLLSLGSETHLRNVELAWLKVVDSHYQDNVDSYEIQYAVNSFFLMRQLWTSVTQRQMPIFTNLYIIPLKIFRTMKFTISEYVQLIAQVQVIGAMTKVFVLMPKTFPLSI